VLHEVLTPDIDDERDLRPERDNIGEVLVGTDAEVGAAMRGLPAQAGNDLLKPLLI
jgi:hypothetical protein